LELLASFMSTPLARARHGLVCDAMTVQEPGMADELEVVLKNFALPMTLFASCCRAGSPGMLTAEHTLQMRRLFLRKIKRHSACLKRARMD